MKFIRNIVSAGMMVSLVLVLVFTVIDVAVLQDRAFFAAQYEKNQVSQVVQVSSEDLMRITDQLLGYMKGEKEELQLDVTVRGSERPFFSQRELDHMVDVRQMVLGAMWVRRVAVVLVLAFLLFPKNRRTFCKTVVFGLPVFLLLLGVLALVGTLPRFGGIFMCSFFPMNYGFWTRRWIFWSILCRNRFLPPVPYGLALALCLAFLRFGAFVFGVTEYKKGFERAWIF